eukprot:scaffold13589_cov179-Alexandrium_tamarense.AAC.6
MQKRITCMRIRGMASPPSMAMMAALSAWRLICVGEVLGKDSLAVREGQLHHVHNSRSSAQNRC